LGVIYFYKKGECSCCYGSEGAFFQIAGNNAYNWSNKDDFVNEWKITFEPDQEKAEKVAKCLSKFLRGSGYRLKWNKDIGTAMYIKSK